MSSTTNAPLTDLIVTVTDNARAKILEIRAGETDPDSLALWLEVTGVADGQYAYDMWFQARSEAGEGDVVQEHDGLCLVVADGSADKLRGATLDLSRDLISGGMVINNPNTPPAQTTPVIDLEGATMDSDIARQVDAVINEQVNPQIAAHGGAASLVGVKDDVAYVRLSGGCQGCAMSRATLTQGIAVMIQEQVPAIAQVLDVTDHASGDNPFYKS